MIGGLKFAMVPTVQLFRPFAVIHTNSDAWTDPKTDTGIYNVCVASVTYWWFVSLANGRHFSDKPTSSDLAEGTGSISGMGAKSQGQ